jgi:hypothetical protein
LRLKLFKIGARIRETSRGVWIHMASGYPYQRLFGSAVEILKAAPRWDGGQNLFDFLICPATGEVRPELTRVGETLALQAEKALDWGLIDPLRGQDPINNSQKNDLTSNIVVYDAG